MSERISGAGTGIGFYLPFLVGDALLLLAAGVVWGQAHRPMTPVEVTAVAGCVGLGAWLGVWPFRLRHLAEMRLTDVLGLRSAVAQINRFEELGQRIETATSQWQRVQDQAGQTAAAVAAVAEKMAAEHKEFQTFLERADHTEREHLRLEVSKLRRAEGDWLQAQVRVLDHVYALYRAGVHSGQENLIEQLTQFQNACRDAVRRLGLGVIQVPRGAAFDSESMQVPGSIEATPATGWVEETLATGYVYQGQLLRKVLVALCPGAIVTGEARSESFGAQPPEPTGADGTPGAAVMDGAGGSEVPR